MYITFAYYTSSKLKLPARLLVGIQDLIQLTYSLWTGGASLEQYSNLAMTLAVIIPLKPKFEKKFEHSALGYRAHCCRDFTKKS